MLLSPSLSLVLLAADGLVSYRCKNLALRGKSPPLLLLLMLIMKVTAPAAAVPFVRLPCVLRLLLGDSCGSLFLPWSRCVLSVDETGDESAWCVLVLPADGLLKRSVRMLLTRYRVL